MPIAITLENYLKEHNVNYDVISHSHTSYSMQSAEAAHIPGNELAKSIILEDNQGRVMATIPATRLLNLSELNKQLNRKLEMISQYELKNIFRDCELGAVPALGEAYGVETIIDECLDDCCNVYFEAGTHTDLIHVSGKDFKDIQHDSKHGRFSRQI